ncbi:DNA-binding protein inhibitor ID-4 [Microcaecilia unicolor]|uniref:DNA-binding protein inhibitor ID-4 n=1 Tax=Microcaecilia unicolor TaxID=1415580 RepID=A0A6P7YJ10_9AMPH|nr:DNA-binding protein inhibitor ID-4 [Microcaecilia unicolor]
MKAVSPLRPQSRRSPAAGGGCMELARRCLAGHNLCTARCKLPEDDDEPLCLQHDMNDCYSRLKRLVPTIPQDRRVSKVEILQHVIDYILDLQLALDTHPALLRQTPPAAATPRTPLTDLNTDPAASVVNKHGDSILCR